MFSFPQRPGKGHRAEKLPSLPGTQRVRRYQFGIATYIGGIIGRLCKDCRQRLLTHFRRRHRGLNMLTLINTNRMLPPIAPVGLDYLAGAARQAGLEVELLDLCLADDPAAALDGYFARPAAGPGRAALPQRGRLLLAGPLLVRPRADRDSPPHPHLLRCPGGAGRRRLLDLRRTRSSSGPGPTSASAATASRPWRPWRRNSVLCGTLGAMPTRSVGMSGGRTAIRSRAGPHLERKRRAAGQPAGVARDGLVPTARDAVTTPPTSAAAGRSGWRPSGAATGSASTVPTRWPKGPAVRLRSPAEVADEIESLLGPGRGRAPPLRQRVQHPRPITPGPSATS